MASHKKSRVLSLTFQKASAGECPGLSATATAPQTDAVGADAQESAAVFLHVSGGPAGRTVGVGSNTTDSKGKAALRKNWDL